MGELQKPFLKWVGGKSQIINNILSIFPQNINNYIEPFLGGGSVLLGLLSLQKSGQITINGTIKAFDLNQSLINVYHKIQNNKDELLLKLNLYKTTYDGLTGNEIHRNPINMEEALSSKESYYYYLRKEFNNEPKTTINSAALFIFINKTCFRGMYREGPNGFNIPYGHYKKTPQMLTKSEIDKISELIQNVEFICADFSTSLENIEEGDFIYLDPPYAPEAANSFVDYNRDGFDITKHKELFNNIIELDKKKALFLMSNAKVKLVTDYFKDKFTINEIECRRAINSKKPQSKTMEVLISNL